MYDIRIETDLSLFFGKLEFLFRIYPRLLMSPSFTFLVLGALKVAILTSILHQFLNEHIRHIDFLQAQHYSVDNLTEIDDGTPVKCPPPPHIDLFAAALPVITTPLANSIANAVCMRY